MKRLEQVFEKIGQTPKGVDCPAIDGLIKEADEVAGEVDDQKVLDAAIIGSAQAVEHYEMSRYGTLIAWAQELGHTDVVSLLNANLKEEKAADLLLFACGPGGDSLPQVGVNLDGTSVSGLSAGAYMAGQLQVAHSDRIIGAGIVAGGPYGCAETPGNELLPTAARNFNRALEGCMSDKLKSQGIPDVRALAEQAEDLAENGSIDPLTGLAKDRVYLFSGGKDHVVARSVVEAARRFYREVGVSEEAITLMTRPDAGHTFLAVDAGNACDVTASPFLGDCNYDQAGAILKWIYGGLQRPSQREDGKYVIFDQSPFVSGLGHGLSSEGVVYIPKACVEQGGCRLHIVLHGCEQNRETVGMKFIEGSGFARWADGNRVVVLFPQVSANPVLNPKGCWDWWGYTGQDYLTKDAPQIAAIWKMAERLAERPVANVTR